MRSYVTLIFLVTSTGPLLAQARTTTSTSTTTPAIGIPSGYSILGDTSVSPPGFTLHGFVQTGGVGIPRAPMPTARFAAASVAVNGKFYVIGGFDNTINGVPLATIEEYDPTTDTWAVKTAMPTARGSVAAAVANGKVYVFGGTDGSSTLNVTEQYDPATDHWVTKKPMLTPRSGASAAEVGGKIYVLGGYSSKVNEAYDPAANSWQTRASSNDFHFFGAAVTILGDVYLAGGYTNTTEVYVATQNAWLLLSPFPGLPYDLGGAELNGQFCAVAASKWYLFDPSTDLWTSAEFPFQREDVAMASIGTDVRIFGGFDELNNVTRTDLQISPPGTLHVHKKN